VIDETEFLFHPDLHVLQPSLEQYLDQHELPELRRQRDPERKMKTILQILTVASLFVLAASCGSSRASVGAHAESIGGPPGVQCYVIISEGRAVGGNCIRY
jgi:hypothetical protein